MKHIDTALEARFAEYVEELDEVLAADVRHVLLDYLDRLIEANSQINLTRIRDPLAGVRLHLVDALVALPEVVAAPPGALLDIGAGGGIPGVPLSVASGRHGLLLDSVAKKMRAVDAIVRDAGLSGTVEVLAGRAEDQAARHRSEFAVVTARAVSELPALVELAAPFLKTHGRFVALKGAPDDQEVERGRIAAEQCGLAQVSIRRAVLPGGDERRMILAYERVGAPRLRLPRRDGLAQNSPLA